MKVLSQPYYNTRCKVRQTWFQKELEGKDLSKLFENGDQLNQDYKRLMRVWDDAIDNLFEKSGRLISYECVLLDLYFY